MEYQKEKDDPEIITIKIFLGENQIAMGTSTITGEASAGANVILPSGMISFENETSLRVTAGVDGGPEVEIVNRKIKKRTS